MGTTAEDMALYKIFFFLGYHDSHKHDLLIAHNRNTHSPPKKESGKKEKRKGLKAF